MMFDVEKNIDQKILISIFENIGAWEHCKKSKKLKGWLILFFILQSISYKNKAPTYKCICLTGLFLIYFIDQFQLLILNVVGTLFTMNIHSTNEYFNYYSYREIFFYNFSNMKQFYQYMISYEFRWITKLKLQININYLHSLIEITISIDKNPNKYPTITLQN